MAFPYIYANNFETADQTGVTSAGWDTETDTASQLDFAHVTELARFPWSTCAPFRGAYAMRAVLSGGTADAYVDEGDIDIAAAATRYFRFYVWFSPDFTATAQDDIVLLDLLATSTSEAVCGFRIDTSNNITLGIGETAPTSFGHIIEKGKWYSVELAVTLDDGVSNDGTIDIYVTGEDEPHSTTVYATQVASLDQGAVTIGRLGVQDHLATTTGTILFDEFAMDDGGRIFPITDRFDDTMTLTQSGHVFVGPGSVDNVTLISGNGTDNIVRIYDTNTADIDDEHGFVTRLSNTAANETVDPAGMPVDLIRGCYVHLEGTDPRATVKICRAVAYGSGPAVKSVASRIEAR